MANRGNQFTTDQWNRIQSVFDEVVDLDSDRRKQRLIDLTADSPEVRDQVESLLEYDVGESLPAVSNLTTTEHPASLHHPGMEIHHYRLLYPLAIRSDSEVWCAESQESEVATPTRVAIKFLRDTDNLRKLDRFRNEAIFLAQFRHPNIAEFLDCGRTAAGTPYIVTRFIVGKTVTEFSDHHQLNVKQRAELMMQICDAIIYAHRYLVVHRDLKPSNILVTNDGHPIILDFGISKVVNDDTAKHEASPPAIQLTTTAERPMTPAYASPEQVRGEPITTATDIHALGLILYELACGHHAFSNTAHPTVGNLFDRISGSLPKPPSEMVHLPSIPLGTDHATAVQCEPVLLAALRGSTPRQLRRQMRRSLDSVTLKAIAKSPDDRYRSVADLRNDLENIVHSRPITARVDRDVIRSSIRKFPIGWVAFSSFVVCGLAALATNLWWQTQWKRQNHELVTVRSQAEAELRRAQSTDLEKEKVQQLFNRVLEWPSRDSRSANRLADDSSAGPDSIPIPGDLSPRQLAKLARRAAENRDIQLAFALLKRLEIPKSESKAEESQVTLEPGLRRLEMRIDVAAAWQMLGRPTTGLVQLGKFVNPKFALRESAGDESTRIELKCVALELLLDAGRVNEARDWISEEYGLPTWETLDARHALLVAESRLKIGWKEGCEEIIQSLRENPRFRLSSNQYLQLALVEQLAEDQPSLDRVISLCEKSQSINQETLAKFSLLRSQLESESGNDAAAISIAKFNSLHLPENHWLQLQATFSAAEAAQRQGQTDKSLEYLRDYWNRAKSIGELGTICSAWTALRIMDKSEAASNRAYLETMRPFRPTIALYPYVEREFLSHEFRTAFEEADYQSALHAATRLYELESELWPASSMYVVYSAAAMADARHRVGKPKEAEHALEKCRQSIREMSEAQSNSNKPQFVSAAFAPILENTEELRRELLLDLPAFQLVRIYIEQNENDAATQLGMLAYHAEQLEKEGRPTTAKSVIRSAVNQLNALQEIPADTVESALRICRLAAMFREYDQAESIVNRYLNSANTEQADAAVSCKIISVEKAGDYDAAIRLADDWLSTSGNTAEHVRAAVWNISQNVTDPDLAQRWKDLLD